MHAERDAGATLDEAFLLTSLAEHACRVIALKKMFVPHTPQERY